MGKWFAGVLAAITLASVALFLMHPWWMPVDISTDGPAIDRQIVDTMIASGALFIIAQMSLAFFAWKFSGGDKKHKVHEIPGGARLMVALAVLMVGAEITVLSLVGSKVWASIYLTPAALGSLRIDVQAEQFAFHFRYPGPDGKFGAIRSDLIDDASGNFFGLDPRDPASADDIVSASLMIPVATSIALSLHSRDVGHSFFVPELRIQQDVVPGLVIPLHFTATRTGKYEIVCTQLCGLGHAGMRAYLEVVTEDQFVEWLSARGRS